MRRRIVVTGARGFIGSHVTEHLTARGDAVTTLVVRAPCDEAALRDACSGADAVVHLAGVISAVTVDRFTAGNVDVTRAVAAAAGAAGARLVYISSLAAGGPTIASTTRREDEAPAPINSYGRSKAAAERVVAATPGLRWTILRPGVVYGPRDRGMLPLFRFASFGVLPFATHDAAVFMFVHVSDAVRAIAAAIDREIDGETMYVAHHRPVGPRELLTAIRDATNPRALIVPIPRPVLYVASFAGEAAGAIVRRPMTINRSRYAELMSDGFVCSVDRLRDRLGIVAEIELADGIRSVAKWYRDAGWI